jgi:catechol 2,3-dioxygenase-like lactoylglutathione lyase family enzyme
VEPLGVHHVAINVTDFEEARRFYVDVLGLRERGDRPDFGISGAWLDAGGQQVHLIEAPPPSNKGQHFALRVDDLEAVIGELRGRGLQVSDAITVGPDLQAFMSDPSGNGIELHQVG